MIVNQRNISPPPSAAELDVLDLIRRLVEHLDARGVEYVHWKSNINIHQALVGIDDLDLLIDRRGTGAVLQVLGDLGFREAREVDAAAIPGIRHYYGLDGPSGRIVHLHLHWQLVLGHDATKNYHLPLERALIASAQRHCLLPTPAAEWELIVYALRCVLKYTVRRNHLARHDRAGHHPELEFLLAGADPSRVGPLLRDHLPSVDAALFSRCLECARPGTSWWRRLRVRGQLHAALAAYARRSRLVDGVLKVSRRTTASLARRLRLARRGKRLVDGGAVMAVVGGDGAGKTTLIACLRVHFAKVFATAQLHLGKPPRGRLTHMVNLVSKVERQCSRLWGGRSSHRLAALRQVCNARDRHRAFARARRLATEGVLVICDRWPVRGLQSMDGPKLVATAHDDRLMRWLIAREQEYFNRILLPDCMIVLRVDPEIAVARVLARNAQEQADLVRPRSQEVWEFEWQRLGAHVSDAARTPEEVLAEAVQAVWRSL